MNQGIHSTVPMTKLIKWGHRAQAMNAKQCRDGDIAGKIH